MRTALPAGRSFEMRKRGSERAAGVMSSTEDVLNVAVAVVLAALAVAVLASAIGEFAALLRRDQVRQGVVALLDNTLLVLMLVEILHTVGISLREHHLVPEPFLVVGMIAAIRRMLIITAELGLPGQVNAATFRLVLQELGLLTLLVLTLVIALIALWRWGVSSDVPEKAEDFGDRHRREDHAMP